MSNTVILDNKEISPNVKPFFSAETETIQETEKSWGGKGLSAVEKEHAKTEAQLEEVFEQAGSDLNLENVTEHLGSDNAATKAEKLAKLNGHLRGLENVIRAKDEFAEQMSNLDEHGMASGPRNSRFDSDFENQPEELSAAIRNNIMRKLPGSVKNLGELVPEGNQQVYDFNLNTSAIVPYLTNATSAAFPSRTVRSGVVAPAPARPPQLLDILGIQVKSTKGGGFAFMRGKTHTSSAAVKAQGAASTEATYEWEEISRKFIKIVSHVGVTEEMLGDTPEVEQLIRDLLDFDVRVKLEDDATSGAGGAGKFEGFLKETGVQSQDFTVVTAGINTGAFDQILAARKKSKVTARALPDTLALHSDASTAMRGIKDTTNQYILGGPLSRGVDELIWGLRLVETEVDGTGYGTANDVVGAVLDSRFLSVCLAGDVSISVGLNADNFAKGIQTLRAMVRGNVRNLRPSAVVKLVYKTA